MSPYLLSLIKLLLLLSFSKSIKIQENDEFYSVPTISHSDVKNGRNLLILKEALESTGMIAIQSSLISKMSRINSLQGLCQCVSQYSTSFLSLKNTDTTFIQDNKTKRTSIATSTLRNFVPLPIDTNSMNQVCHIDHLGESMEQLRDDVHSVSLDFITAMDYLFFNNEQQQQQQNQEQPILKSTTKAYLSFHEIVKDANHLEHFHVYETLENSKEEVLTPHTDVGLFLSFVPGFDCTSSSPSSSNFNIMVEGRMKEVIFPEDSVIFMLGVGAQDWIFSKSQLKATKHSLEMPANFFRSWYGIMYLVPENSIIQSFPTLQTFSDIRSSMTFKSSRHSYSKTFSKSNSFPAIGCGSEAFSTRPRLLQHADASTCNNETNFYCWMTCIDTPSNVDETLQNLEQNQLLYCADQTVYEETKDLGVAVQACTDSITGLVGTVMNTNCMGFWHEAQPDVSDQQLNIEYTLQNDKYATSSTTNVLEQPYCYGGTSMYMDGFQWKGVYCVIYLFPSWILNTPWKMVLACVGTIFSCILLEFVITIRRLVLPTISNFEKRITVSTLLYGTQLTLGYFIMLVVMTYSAPLFLSIIIGLMIGHYIFQKINSKSTTKIKNKASIIIEGATPCCQNEVMELSPDVAEKILKESYQSFGTNVKKSIHSSSEASSSSITDVIPNNCGCDAAVEAVDKVVPYETQQKKTIRHCCHGSNV